MMARQFVCLDRKFKPMKEKRFAVKKTTTVDNLSSRNFEFFNVEFGCTSDVCSS